MINSPIKYGPKEPLGRSVTKSPTPAPNKHMLLAMNELMKKMGFFNITKLKEVHSKHHHDDAEFEIQSMKVDANDVKAGLQSVKKGAVIFEDLPMISYDYEHGQNGWRSIYNGILSPFANKYQVYVKSELKHRMEMQKAAADSRQDSRTSLYSNNVQNHNGIVGKLLSPAQQLQRGMTQKNINMPNQDIQKRKPQIGLLSSIFNIREMRKQKVLRNLKEFDEWSKRNPTAAGKSQINQKQTKIEQFYCLKRKKIIHRDRSFDLHLLRKDINMNRLFSDQQISRKLLKMNYSIIRRKSCICKDCNCKNLVNDKLQMREILINNEIQVFQMIVTGKKNRTNQSAEEDMSSRSFEYSQDEEEDRLKMLNKMDTIKEEFEQQSPKNAARRRVSDGMHEDTRYKQKKISLIANHEMKVNRKKTQVKPFLSKPSRFEQNRDFKIVALSMGGSNKEPKADTKPGPTYSFSSALLHLNSQQQMNDNQGNSPGSKSCTHKKMDKNHLFPKAGAIHGSTQSIENPQTPQAKINLDCLTPGNRQKYSLLQERQEGSISESKGSQCFSRQNTNVFRKSQFANIDNKVRDLIVGKLQKQVKVKAHQVKNEQLITQLKPKDLKFEPLMKYSESVHDLHRPTTLQINELPSPQHLILDVHESNFKGYHTQELQRIIPSDLNKDQLDQLMMLKNKIRTMKLIVNHPKTKYLLKMDNQNFKSDVFIKRDYEKSTEVSDKECLDHWHQNQKKSSQQNSRNAKIYPQSVGIGQRVNTWRSSDMTVITPGNQRNTQKQQNCDSPERKVVGTADDNKLRSRKFTTMDVSHRSNSKPSNHDLCIPYLTPVLQKVVSEQPMTKSLVFPNGKVPQKQQEEGFMQRRRKQQTTRDTELPQFEGKPKYIIPQQQFASPISKVSIEEIFSPQSSVLNQFSKGRRTNFTTSKKCPTTDTPYSQGNQNPKRFTFSFQKKQDKKK